MTQSQVGPIPVPPDPPVDPAVLVGSDASSDDAPTAATLDERSVSIRFRRLVRIIEEGRGVPFLGAGISNDATLGEDHPSCANWWPTTKHLCKLLNESLEKKLDQGWADERKPPIPIPQPAAHSPSCRENAHKKDSLAQLAEMHTWWSSAGETCKTIRLECFTRLEPTPAHRYLAMLAREGLIREIITTNYDTCLEKAYQQTFASSELDDDDHPCVVTTLEEYQKKGSKRQDALGRPLLHIYKVNGCAKKWESSCGSDVSDPLCERASQAIVLTERQLQNFRQSLWAQDLLRDRARSRSLVFSGFGAEEPQVRHTLLAIAAEFMSSFGQSELAPCNLPANEKSSSDQSQSRSGLWDQANAPFMTQFESSLTFSQKQLLREYALGSSNRDEPCGIKDLIGEGANYLTGIDSAAISPPFSRNPTDTQSLPSSGKAICATGARPEATTSLPADLVWMRVYQAAFKSLMERETREGSLFFDWLRDAGIPRPGLVSRSLIEWIYPPEHRQYPPSLQVELFGRFEGLLEVDGREGFRSTTLSCWVHAARGCPGDHFGGQLHRNPQSAELRSRGVPYAALRDDPCLVLSLLLILRILFGNDRDPTKLRVSSSVSSGLAFLCEESADSGQEERRATSTILLLETGEALESPALEQGESEYFGASALVVRIRIHLSRRQTEDRNIRGTWTRVQPDKRRRMLNNRTSAEDIVREWEGSASTASRTPFPISTIRHWVSVRGVATRTRAVLRPLEREAIRC